MEIFLRIFFAHNCVKDSLSAIYTGARFQKAIFKTISRHAFSMAFSLDIRFKRSLKGLNIISLCLKTLQVFVSMILFDNTHPRL